MAADERNFRSSYYEKVGFRSVEEKKSLEILMKDKPLDRQKLKQFCLRFTVPSTYRLMLWKVLLGVTPRYSSNNDFVWKQRTETYEELLRALQVMQLVKSDMPKQVKLLVLWLLETGEIKYDLQTQLDDPVFKGLIAISGSLTDIIEGDVDTYWIARGLFRLVIENKEVVSRLSDSANFILEKEDPELFSHLVQLSAFHVIRADRWFHCLFAGVLHEAALVKIWDKLIGGSFKILSFVAVVILTTLRRPILNATAIGTILEELRGISDETSEVICNKAIDLWLQYGSPLQVCETRKEEIRYYIL